MAEVPRCGTWTRVLVVTLVAGCTTIINASKVSAQNGGNESVAVVAPAGANAADADSDASISPDAIVADAPSSDSSSAPAASSPSGSQAAASPSSVLIPRTAAEIEADEENVQPWDFSPYKMLVWVVSDDPRIDAATIDAPLRAYLDRHYSSIWRVTIADAPSAVGSTAARDLSALDFDGISASDPVIAVKRNHKDALRIRVAGNIDEYVGKVYATAGMIDAVTRRGEQIGDKTIEGAANKFEAIDGDALALQELWNDEKTEALLVPRGLATVLDEPEAKLVDLPLADLVSTAIDRFDKIFIVVVDSNQLPRRVSVVAFETLMHYFGDVVQEVSVTASDLPDAIGRALSDAFLPELRIDDAGLKGAQGLIRAGGLILDEQSPGLVKEG
ncbi:MAG: hypothetical protein HKN47_27835, partial [Pirellulaceae bacterium]|nr:hypothetical protein [Pirellulaceae bacterium]